MAARPGLCDRSWKSRAHEGKPGCLGSLVLGLTTEMLLLLSREKSFAGRGRTQLKKRQQGGQEKKTVSRRKVATGSSGCLGSPRALPGPHARMSPAPAPRGNRPAAAPEAERGGFRREEPGQHSARELQGHSLGSTKEEGARGLRDPVLQNGIRRREGQRRREGWRGPPGVASVSSRPSAL